MSSRITKALLPTHPVKATWVNCAAALLWLVVIYVWSPR